MPDFASHLDSGFLEIISATPNIAAGGSTNTKGSYVEIVASTSRDYDYLLVAVDAINANRTGLIDFAIGGAGSEVVIFPNFICAGSPAMATYVVIPVMIPAGTRISARSQSTTASASHRLTMSGGVGGFWRNASGGKLTAIGADTSDSGGTSVNAGAVAGTYGAWSQLTASTADDIAALLLQLGNNSNTAPATLGLLNNTAIQIGRGSGGSEVPILEFAFTTNAIGTYGPLPPLWLPVSIPSGTRLAARVKMNTTDATDRVCDVVAYARTN